MPRKRLLWLILLILIGGTGWSGYRAVHQSVLNHNLILASVTEDPETVRRLLDQGADPNTREDNSLQTAWQRFLHLFVHDRPYNAYICPLSQALVSGTSDAKYVEIVRLLLEHHANPNLKLPGGMPLPIRAMMLRGEEERVPALFLQYGADPNTLDEDVASRSSLLMYAIHAHQEALVEMLLNQGAKPNLANVQGDSALMWAAFQQDSGMLKLLLAHGADIHHTNNKGQTALTYALVRGGPLQSAILESLLAAGADVNAPDLQKFSPFLWALTNHNPGVDAMLARGGDVRQAIPLSVVAPNLVVTLRLEHASTLVNIATSVIPGTTPLMFAVRAHNAELVRKMLAKGADVNARDVKGKTALDYDGHIPEIRALLQKAGARE